MLNVVNKAFLKLFVAVAPNLAYTSVRIVLYTVLVTVNSGIYKL